MASKRIGFFGGCFNPPSNIHISLAKKVLEENNLDQVVFVPVGDFYEKVELAEAKHRYNMLKIVVEKEKKIDVDDIELKVEKKLYATDAFQLIEEKYQGNDIYYIMGSDNYEKMPKWRDYENIKDKYKYIVVKRQPDEISSTSIRNMIKNKDENVLNILDKDVYEYIKRHKLYE